MRDQELDTLLKSIPREPAHPDFGTTLQRRLARLEHPSPTHRFAWRGLAFAATVLAVALLSFGLWRTERARDITQDRVQLESLRAEYAAISHDLDQLSSTEPRLPLVYLGGGEQVDVVVDLERLRHGDTTATQSEKSSLESAHKSHF